MTGEAASALAPLLPGQRLGAFELLGLVSRGGMGEIWLGRRASDPGQLYALKTLLPNLVDAPKMRLMFVEETRIAAQLVHPNVVRLVDAGEPLPVPYYAMEWVDGAPLDELYAAAAIAPSESAGEGHAQTAAEGESASMRHVGRGLPIGVLLRIVLEAAHGLHAAHELRDAEGRLRDVVHRDVSPSNVMVGRDGVAKITDFGIARARDRLAKTTTGGFRGKLAYVAPEQALGRDVDRRADVWGLGAVLYEGLAGRAPYQGPDEAALIAQLVTGPPQFVFSADVPRPLVTVLRRAMAYAPAARYPTAEAFARDLEAERDALGLAVTTADVAAVVEARLGAAIRARTERLLRHSTLKRRPAARTASRLALGTLAVAGIGAIGAAALVRSSPPPSAPSPVATASTVASTAAGSLVTPPTRPSPSAEPASVPTPAPQPPVVRAGDAPPAQGRATVPRPRTAAVTARDAGASTSGPSAPREPAGPKTVDAGAAPPVDDPGF